MCDGYRGYGQEQLPKATFGSCLIIFDDLLLNWSKASR